MEFVVEPTIVNRDSPTRRGSMDVTKLLLFTPFTLLLDSLLDNLSSKVILSVSAIRHAILLLSDSAAVIRLPDTRHTWNVLVCVCVCVKTCLRKSRD